MDDPQIELQLVPVEDLALLLARFEEAARTADEVVQRNTLSSYQEVKRPNTLERQRAEIANFEAFLKASGVPLTGLVDDLSLWSGLTHGLLVTFRQWMLQQGYRTSVINLHLSTMRVYAGLAHDAGYLPSERYDRIKHLGNITVAEGKILDENRAVTHIGHKKLEPTPITPEQINLIKQLLKEKGTPEAARDLFMLCLMANHALRVSEVAGLAFDWLDMRAGRIKIDRRKTVLTHRHKLLPETIAAAHWYLETWRGRLTDQLFDLAPRTIRWRVRKWGQMIGIKNLSPHDLRHYFATYAEGDILDIAKAGGWTNVNMLFRYRVEQENANEGVTMPGEKEEGGNTYGWNKPFP